MKSSIRSLNKKSLLEKSSMMNFYKREVIHDELYIRNVIKDKHKKTTSVMKFTITKVITMKFSIRKVIGDEIFFKKSYQQ